jgi:putative tricarboxylic transport membrane protein
VPFKSGAETDVQLSGGHVDSHVNNPSESIGSWRAGKVRPLCVFNPGRLPAGPKVTETQGWSDIPSCKDEGIAVDSFTQPRVVWMAGKVPTEAQAFFVDLMDKVSKTPEWKDYIDKTSQTSRFIGGADFKAFVDKDHARMRAVFEEQGWLVK